MDKALRLWNFLDKSSELISFFQDSPLAVSLHPSGLYLLVAFGEKVSLLMSSKRATTRVLHIPIVWPNHLLQTGPVSDGTIRCRPNGI